MDKLVSIFDGLDSKDHARLTAFDTSIDIINLDTGECIFKGLKNKVIIPGSGFIARKLFNITGDEVTPSYNESCDKYNINMYTPTTDTVPSNESDAKATMIIRKFFYSVAVLMVVVLKTPRCIL